MTTWFVTRHQGVVAWAARQGITVDRMVDHLNFAEVGAGDEVSGTLPVNLTAEVCAKGARYRHLVLNTPPTARGRELTPEEMEAFGARLTEYRVERVEEE